MFAQLITGIIVFMICSMLRWVQLELGFVLGLFAIFQAQQASFASAGIKGTDRNEHHPFSDREGGLCQKPCTIKIYFTDGGNTSFNDEENKNDDD